MMSNHHDGTAAEHAAASRRVGKGQRGAASAFLPTVSLPGFAGGIAGVTSGLRLSFGGGLPGDPGGIFGLPGLLFGLQGGFTSGGLGKLRSGQVSGPARFRGCFGSLPLRNPGIASFLDLIPRRPALGGGGAIGGGPGLGDALQQRLLRLCGCTQAISKIVSWGLVHLILVTGESDKWGMWGPDTTSAGIPFREGSGERATPGPGAALSSVQILTVWGLVEPRGIEPLTSALRTRRSPS